MARKIIGAAFLSLDGVMQAPGGPEEDPTGGFSFGGWLEPIGDDELDAKIGELFGRPFDLLLGRRTYDIFAAYWPFISHDNPIAATFGKVSKYVLTGSEAPLEWVGSHRLSGIDALAALKAESGPDLVIQGSSTLYPQLLKAGLIDRLELMIAPVVLGSGKRLFGDGTPPGSFRMIEHKLSRGGIQMASFEPAGPVKTGTFETQEPSAPERERRSRMEAGTW